MSVQDTYQLPDNLLTVRMQCFQSSLWSLAKNTAETNEEIK
jgi:hypothetical protein